MLWKIIAATTGGFFLSLIFLLFAWTQWEDDSELHAEHVQKNLRKLESFWNKQSSIKNGNIKIGYSELVRTGFPFDVRIRLLQPYIRERQGSVSIALTNTFLEFVPTGDEMQPYAIEYPNDAHAVIDLGNGQKLNYYISLDELPELHVRKREVNGRQSKAFNEYGVTYPDRVTVRVDRGGKLRQYPFVFTRTQEPVWRPMLSNMREMLTYVRDVLRRGNG